MAICSIVELGTWQSVLIDTAEQLKQIPVLPDNAMVVDVGANIGQFAFAIKAIQPTAQILCIEADPQTFGKLEANVGKWPGVRCVCAAAGSEHGKALLFRHPSSVMSSLVGDQSLPAVQVQVVPLDDLVDFSAVYLLKIDVEGFEDDVIRGAADVLRHTRYVQIELSLERPAQSGAMRVLRLVAEACPEARLVGFGRPLGANARQAQDVIIAMGTRS